MGASGALLQLRHTVAEPEFEMSRVEQISLKKIDKKSNVINKKSPN
jgi:hypothetical protein